MSNRGGALKLSLLLAATLLTLPVASTHAQSDIDRDGIDDSVDKCPNLQEDYQKELDGCAPQTTFRGTTRTATA